MRPASLAETLPGAFLQQAGCPGIAEPAEIRSRLMTFDGSSGCSSRSSSSSNSSSGATRSRSRKVLEVVD